MDSYNYRSNENIKLSSFSDLMRLPVNDINNIFNHFIRAIDIINFNINRQFVNQINEIYKIYNDYLTIQLNKKNNLEASPSGLVSYLTKENNGNIWKYGR